MSPSDQDAGAAPALPIESTDQGEPAAQPPAAEPLTEGDVAALASRGIIGAGDAVESDESFTARMNARREARARLRAETPAQVLELKAQGGTSHLGVIIQGQDGSARVHPLCDWRTDLIRLQAGDTATIVVLVGEDLETYLHFAKREQADKQLNESVKTVAQDPAPASDLAAAAVAAQE